MSEPLVEVLGKRFDPNAFAARVPVGDAGAVVTFTGVCRSEDGRLAALELEHYPGMAERKLREIARATREACSLLAVGVAHRHGVVPVGETIVCVVAAARHRREAFDGASRIMDYLKTDAPFWKKEHAVEGESGRWVDARGVDDDARSAWEDATRTR